jgi:hypothetical protein
LTSATKHYIIIADKQNKHRNKRENKQMNTRVKELFIAVVIGLAIFASYYIVTCVETHDTIKCHYDTESGCLVQYKTDRVVVAPKDFKKDLTNGDYYVTLDNNNTDDLFEDDKVIKINRVDN